MNRQQEYAAAYKEVEKRRRKAEMDGLLRRDELFEKYPEIERLNARVLAAGAEAAKLAAGGFAADARAKLAEVKEVNSRLQAALQAAGCTESALAPSYTCPFCRDTGRRDGKTCRCVQNIVNSARMEDINTIEALAHCSFATFDVMRYDERDPAYNFSPRAVMAAMLAECREYAAVFGLDSESLYLYGDAGLGKTHLAVSVAKAVIPKGYDVVYVSAQSAFDTVKRQAREPGGGLFGEMLHADLLVLDDLGTEYLDAYVRSKLYELMNARMGNRPTIYTTNIGQQAVLEQRYTEKISSRLLGDCHPMHFFGKDLRLQRQNGA